MGFEWKGIFLASITPTSGGSWPNNAENAKQSV